MASYTKLRLNYTREGAYFEGSRWRVFADSDYSVELAALGTITSDGNNSQLGNLTDNDNGTAWGDNGGGTHLELTFHAPQANAPYTMSWRGTGNYDRQFRKATVTLYNADTAQWEAWGTWHAAGWTANQNKWFMPHNGSNVLRFVRIRQLNYTGNWWNAAGIDFKTPLTGSDYVNDLTIETNNVGGGPYNLFDGDTSSYASLGMSETSWTIFQLPEAVAGPVSHFYLRNRSDAATCPPGFVIEQSSHGDPEGAWTIQWVPHNLTWANGEQKEFVRPAAAASYRYWGIVSRWSGPPAGTDGLALTRLEWRETVGGPDISVYANAFGLDSGYSVSNLYDGNDGTMFYRAGVGAFAGMSWSTPKAIAQILLRSRSDSGGHSQSQSPRAGWVVASPDGVNFLIQSVFVTAMGHTQALGDTHTHTLDPAWATKRNAVEVAFRGLSYIGITELQIRDASNVNLAVGSAGAAFSLGTHYSQAPYAAVDQNNGTEHIFSNSNPEIRKFRFAPLTPLTYVKDVVYVNRACCPDQSPSSAHIGYSADLDNYAYTTTDPIATPGAWNAGLQSQTYTNPEPPPPTPTAVLVSPATLDLSVGDTGQLIGQVLDEDDDEIVGEALAWSSGDEAVATVDADGLVTAVAPGEATITATSGVLTDTALVTVAALATGSLLTTMRTPSAASFF